MWFLVGMDLSLAKLERLPALGERSSAGRRSPGSTGPFESPEDAEAYRPLVEDNGTEPVLVEPTDPASFPRGGEA